MIRLVQWLVIGHIHKWKTIDVLDLWKSMPNSTDRPIGHVYVQQCEHCGTVQRKDLT